MDPKNTRNLLLQELPPEDYERLRPHFENQSLAFKEALFDQDDPVEHVYFPETGVVSLVTDFDDQQTIETGTIGREGLVGLSAVLGIDTAPYRAFCQIPGEAWRLPSTVVASERTRGSQWFLLLLRYASYVNATTAQIAACNRVHTDDARMSRWLLMMHDRVERADFPLTQEFLGQMLGVARPTVNVVGASLERAGFIKYTRGRITIVDRKGLESASCGCYGQIRQAFEQAVTSRRKSHVTRWKKRQSER